MGPTCLLPTACVRLAAFMGVLLAWVVFLGVGFSFTWLRLERASVAVAAAAAACLLLVRVAGAGVALLALAGSAASMVRDARRAGCSFTSSSSSNSRSRLAKALVALVLPCFLGCCLAGAASSIAEPPLGPKVTRKPESLEEPCLPALRLVVPSPVRHQELAIVVSSRTGKA